MSSVLDYFTSAVSNTYTETVDYWSKDGSISDAVDVVAWSVQNTDIVADATSKGIQRSTQEFKTAVNQDFNKVIIIALGLIGSYLYLTHKKK